MPVLSLPRGPCSHLTVSMIGGCRYNDKLDDYDLLN